MGEQRSSIKMGMLPILTLVVSLCLFVLAVLALSTAHAAGIISDRQAEATSEGYVVEAAGQHLVGEVDAVLAEAASAGIADRFEAADSVAGSLPSIIESVTEAHPGISAEAEVQGSQVIATLEGTTGRHLVITLQVTDDLGYQISHWSLTTAQADEGGGDILWSGM